jgi:hypothetical protein
MISPSRAFFVLGIVWIVGCGTQVSTVGDSTRTSSTELQKAGNGQGNLDAPESRGTAKRIDDLPPERTPEDDASVTRFGPKLGVERRLASANASCECFSPEVRSVVYQDGSTVWGLALDQLDRQPMGLARFPFTPRDVRVLNEDLDLIVLEAESDEPGRWSSTDPMRIWWIDQGVNEKELLRGPEKDLSLAEDPVSPDHRFVAFHQWQDNPESQGLTKALFILDRNDGSTLMIQVPKADLSISGWKTTEAGLRAVAVTNRGRADESQTSEIFLVDPTNGTLQNQTPDEPQRKTDKHVSPDAKFHVRVEPEELVVTSTVDGEERRFFLHADDRRFVNDQCIEWVSPRYFKFNGPRLALIDMTTMLMNFPSSGSGLRIAPQTCKFSRDFHWVVFRAQNAEGESLFVAPVELSQE